ncbi:MAG: endonuclease domain-containing protein [Actinobacteria bacterium]|nr:endonuclease domain-containing protein [Actinomycetota bacterium]
MRDVLIERMALLGLAEGPMDEEFLRIMKAAGVDLPEPQVEIHRRGGRLIARVDFVYHQYKLVIELDGEAFSFRSRLLSQGSQEAECACP